MQGAEYGFSWSTPGKHAKELTAKDVEYSRKLSIVSAIFGGVSETPTDTDLSAASRSVPEFVKLALARTAFEWLLSVVRIRKLKDSSQSKGSVKEPARASTDSGDFRCWKLLAKALDMPLVRDSVPVPASLSLAIAAAAEASSTEEDGQAVSCVLNSLQHVVWHPSLSQCVSMTVGVLKAASGRGGPSPWEPAAVASVRMLNRSAGRASDPRKVFMELIDVRVLGPLLSAATAGEGDSPGPAPAAPPLLQEVCQEALSAALLTPENSAALAEECYPLMVSASGSVRPEDAACDGRKGAAGKERPGGQSHPHYQWKLLESLRHMAGSSAEAQEQALAALPWVLQRLGASLKRHTAQREGPEPGAPSKAPAEGKPLGLALFFELSRIALGAVPRQGGSSPEGRERTARAALSACAGLVEALHREGLYCASEDSSGLQLRCLESLASEAMAVAKREPGLGVARTCARLVSAMLLLEHRAIEPRLQEVWECLWQLGSAGGDGASACLDSAVATAVSVCSCYAEVRQMQWMLDSLLAAVADAAHDGGAGAVLSDERLLSSLRGAIGSLHAGQAAPLVLWVSRRSWGDSRTLKILGPVCRTCLENTQVVLTTAMDVAAAARDVIGGGFGERLAAEADAFCARGHGGEGGSFAMLLGLYNAVLNLHSRCCDLHPEVVPLPGQRLGERHGKLTSYFEPIAAEGRGAPSLSAVARAALSSYAGETLGCGLESQAAVLEAVLQRMQVLSEGLDEAQHAYGEISGSDGIHEEAIASELREMAETLAEVFCLSVARDAEQPTVVAEGGREPSLFARLFDSHRHIPWLSFAGERTVRNALSTLLEHCVDLGRDPQEIASWIHLGGRTLREALSEAILELLERHMRDIISCADPGSHEQSGSATETPDFQISGSLESFLAPASAGQALSSCWKACEGAPSSEEPSQKRHRSSSRASKARRSCQVLMRGLELARQSHVVLETELGELRLLNGVLKTEIALATLLGPVCAKKKLRKCLLPAVLELFVSCRRCVSSVFERAPCPGGKRRSALVLGWMSQSARAVACAALSHEAWRTAQDVEQLVWHTAKAVLLAVASDPTCLCEGGLDVQPGSRQSPDRADSAGNEPHGQFVAWLEASVCEAAVLGALRGTAAEHGAVPETICHEGRGAPALCGAPPGRLGHAGKPGAGEVLPSVRQLLQRCLVQAESVERGSLDRLVRNGLLSEEDTALLYSYCSSVNALGAAFRLWETTSMLDADEELAVGMKAIGPRLNAIARLFPSRLGAGKTPSDEKAGIRLVGFIQANLEAHRHVLGGATRCRGTLPVPLKMAMLHVHATTCVVSNGGLFPGDAIADPSGIRPLPRSLQISFQSLVRNSTSTDRNAVFGELSNLLLAPHCLEDGLAALMMVHSSLDTSRSLDNASSMDADMFRRLTDGLLCFAEALVGRFGQGSAPYSLWGYSSVLVMSCLQSLISRERKYRVAPQQVGRCLSLPFHFIKLEADRGLADVDIVWHLRLFIECCRLASNLIRIHGDGARRCMAVALGSLRMLMDMLMKYFSAGEDKWKLPAGKYENHTELFSTLSHEISEALKAVALLGAATSDSAMYILGHYIVLATKNPGALPYEMSTTLKSGMLSLYGICTKREAAHLNVMLGALHGKRELLVKLRKEYETQFKFAGKV